MNVAGPCWWYVSIGSSNGLVPSGNKPFIWTNVNPVLCHHMASLGHNDLNISLTHQCLSLISDCHLCYIGAAFKFVWFKTIQNVVLLNITNHTVLLTAVGNHTVFSCHCVWYLGCHHRYIHNYMLLCKAILPAGNNMPESHQHRLERLHLQFQFVWSRSENGCWLIKSREIGQRFICCKMTARW